MTIPRRHSLHPPHSLPTRYGTKRPSDGTEFSMDLFLYIGNRLKPTTMLRLVVVNPADVGPFRLSKKDGRFLGICGITDAPYEHQRLIAILLKNTPTLIRLSVLRINKVQEVGGLRISGGSFVLFRYSRRRLFPISNNGYPKLKSSALVISGELPPRKIDNVLVSGGSSPHNRQPTASDTFPMP